MRSRTVTRDLFETAHLPTALQEDEKLCHFHLGPYFVLLLRDAYFKYKILRDFYRKTHAYNELVCLSKLVQNQRRMTRNSQLILGGCCLVLPYTLGTRRGSGVNPSATR